MRTLALRGKFGTMASTSKSKQTLSLIKLQHQHEGKLPHLNAVTTIFFNLLEHNEKDDVWQLFYEVAALPLATTRLEVSCVAEGSPCEQRTKKGHCFHKQVEVATNIKLDKVDEHLFSKGRRIKDAVQHWWGNQMAVALGGKFLS